MQSKLAYVLTIVWMGTTWPVGAQESSIDYVRDIKPIFRRHCLACHGALKQAASLRLDTADAMRLGGESGPALADRLGAASLLVQRMKGEAGLARMPPADEGEPLLPEQIELIRTWIDRGAAAPADDRADEDPRQHWSFTPPVKRPFPFLGFHSANAIDAWIAHEFQKRQLTPGPPAERAVLLRRLYIDLTGLPPSRDELQAFLADPTPDAHLRVVDRLLSSPHYGERWARHWMDVWRYSDWYGRRAVPDVWNSAPQIWRWRDWIVRSLNDDRGYDRMLQEMLAADELAPDDLSAQAATGFLVRNWYALNPNQWMKDTVEHTGKAFLGLTINCCHCHDHKYDPISQEEYFRFRACFEPLQLRQDRFPGEPDPGPFQKYDYAVLRKVVREGIVRVFDERPDAPTFMYRLGDERNRIEGSEAVSPGGPAFLGGGDLRIQPVDLPLVAWYPELSPAAVAERLSAAERQVVESEQKLAQAEANFNGVAQATARAPAAPDTRPVDILGDSILGDWRFEGADDASGFLADSSGRGHTLERIHGEDPPAAPAPIRLWGAGYRFSATARPDNGQAARFQQVNSFSYLATAAAPDLHAQVFTLEVCLHVAAAAENYNRTIAELDGSWKWLHRGLSAAKSELRLLYNNAAGQQRDLATGGGEAALTIATGHDYYLALVVAPDRVGFYARDLTTDGPLVAQEHPRNMAGDASQDSSMIHEPLVGGRFKIGNSEGTGRHNGLIDEVRLVGAALSAAQVAQRSGGGLSTPEARAARAAAVESRVALELAQARLASLKARAEAERARYEDPDDPQLAGLAHKAAAADREERIAEANLQAASAARQYVSAQQASAVDAAAGQTSLSVAEAKLAEATLAVDAAQAASDGGYRPLGQVFPATSTGRRLALARWISNSANPLTARVAVNHIWLRHFGRPLVTSVNDFGRNGQRPSHPELLDWLAVEFMESGWSMKHLHRLIVTSETYRRTSASPIQDGDPDNVYLSRFPTRRIESEVVRDSLLATAGELDVTLGGPVLENTQELQSRRRSMYFSVYPEDGGQLKMLDLFDAPDPCDCYRRSEGIVPQQALVMSNGPLALNASRWLAGKLWRAQATSKNPPAEAQLVRVAFEQVLTRGPSAAELELCLSFLARQRALFDAAGPPAPADGLEPAASDPALRAYESLVQSLFSHHEFFTIR